MSVGIAGAEIADQYPRLRQVSEEALTRAYSAGSRPVAPRELEEAEEFPCACGSTFELQPAGVGGPAQDQYARHVRGIRHATWSKRSGWR